METIIVSACLLGDKTRYDGKTNYDPLIEKVKENYNIVPICPEVMGGMSIPREPTELITGFPYLKSGKDVSSNFNKGTKQVVNIVKYLKVKKAILVDRSPSCGIHKIHNGYFNGVVINGQGFTTQRLRELGIECFTLNEFCEKYLNENEEK